MILHPGSTYTAEDRLVSAEDDYEITIRVITPTSTDTNKTFPLLYWIHGGGFFIGNMDMDEYWLSSLAVKLQLIVVGVNYRLAPEFPFPTGLTDTYTTLKWSVLNSSTIKADLHKGFLVGGNSAGANFAATIALKARDDPFFKEEGCPITGQLLQVPNVVHPKADLPDKFKVVMNSLEENKDAPGLNSPDWIQMAENYHAPPNHPEVSPLLAPRHSGLPSAYFQVCGYDPLRDQGILYEEVLRENDVRTKIDLYPGVLHGGGFYFLYDLPIAAKLRRDVVEGTKWLLENGGNTQRNSRE
ncbi:alpha/beta-hydrolase [Abortiporus biennis]|nr:alpha/beta-hydrolase [Abortiporus biennis]